MTRSYCVYTHGSHACSPAHTCPDTPDVIVETLGGDLLYGAFCPRSVTLRQPVPNAMTSIKAASEVGLS